MCDLYKELYKLFVKIFRTLHNPWHVPSLDLEPKHAPDHFFSFLLYAKAIYHDLNAKFCLTNLIDVNYD